MAAKGRFSGEVEESGSTGGAAPQPLKEPTIATDRVSLTLKLAPTVLFCCCIFARTLPLTAELAAAASNECRALRHLVAFARLLHLISFFIC